MKKYCDNADDTMVLSIRQGEEPKDMLGSRNTFSRRSPTSKAFTLRDAIIRGLSSSPLPHLLADSFINPFPIGTLLRAHEFRARGLTCHAHLSSTCFPCSFRAFHSRLQIPTSDWRQQPAAISLHRSPYSPAVDCSCHPPSVASH